MRVASLKAAPALPTFWNAEEQTAGAAQLQLRFPLRACLPGRPAGSPGCLVWGPRWPGQGAQPAASSGRLLSICVAPRASRHRWGFCSLTCSDVARVMREDEEGHACRGVEGLPAAMLCLGRQSCPQHDNSKPVFLPRLTSTLPSTELTPHHTVFFVQ